MTNFCQRVVTVKRLLLLGCLRGQNPEQEMNSTFYVKKETKWRTELPEGFACPFPTS